MPRGLQNPRGRRPSLTAGSWVTEEWPLTARSGTTAAEMEGSSQNEENLTHEDTLYKMELTMDWWVIVILLAINSS